MIVTSRLEKYRPETEEWLKLNMVKYKQLIMLDMKSKEERVQANVHSKNKALIYKNSNCELFYESNYKQAKEIYNIAKKPVFCVDENILIKGGKIEQLLYSPKKTKKSIISHRLRQHPVLYKLVLKIFSVMRRKIKQ